MALADSGGAFAAVMAHFANPQAGEHMLLHVTLRPADGKRALSPAEAREALYDDQPDASLAASIWRETIRAAQSDEAPDSPWHLLLIWLALPRLTGTVHRIAARLRVSRLDLESEMVLTLLEQLPTIDPDEPGSIEQLLRTARSRAWRYARSGSRDTPSANIEDTMARHGHTGAVMREPVDEREFDLELLPLPGPTGLHAELRFTRRSGQLEGERLGMLAGRLGLHDVVRQARRSGGRRKVGTLSLRPRRRRR